MIFKVLFHLVSAAQFFYGCYYDYSYVRFPTPMSGTSYGGKFKYLTFINAMMQTLYFTITALNDVIGTNEPNPSRKPIIRRIRDTMFSSLAFPVAMFVGVTFWAIYGIDRELILPRHLDEVFPSWLNHVMHTNIMFCALIELATSFRMYPTRRTGLTLLSIFMIAYAVWLHVVYFETGAWVYPVLAVLNWPVRIVFYIASIGIVFSLYILGERLNRSLWSQEIMSMERSTKKKVK